MKRIGLGVLVWLVCCVAAANASAKTYCVQPENSGCDQTVPDFQTALTDAGQDSSADTVKLGATTYTGTSAFSLSSAGNNPVTIVGKGAGQTVLTAPTGNNGYVLSITDTNATLSSVGIVIPQGSNNTGLVFSASEADGIAITGPSATSPTGLSIVAGTFQRGSIELPEGGSTGVAASGGTIEDTTVVAHNGISASGAGAGLGANVTARHDTVLGDAATGSAGVSAHALAYPQIGASLSVTVDDSIVRHFASDLVRQGAPGDNNCMANFDGCPTSAFLAYGYDDFDTAMPQSTDTGPGGYTDNLHNQNVDPGFVAASASPPDYHPLYSPNSPLIDKGMATPESGESTTDEDGNPRTVGAATDIGAYEYQHRPPVIIATATPSSAQTDSPVTFTATASDPDPGDTVTVSWAVDDGTTGSGTSLSHAFTTAGTHTVTATATDPTGLTKSSSTTVTVTAPAGPVGPTGPTGPTGPAVPTANGFPVISHLNLTPTAFRAAPSGPSISAAKTGTTISYTDSQAADTSFIVERIATGIRRGRSCVSPPRTRPKHAKRCTLFVHLGGFVHRDVAGVNRFHFSGRLFGAALAPASYRLSAQPENSKLLVGNMARTPFRIIAPPPRRHHRHQGRRVAGGVTEPGA